MPANYLSNSPPHLRCQGSRKNKMSSLSVHQNIFSPEHKNYVVLLIKSVLRFSCLAFFSHLYSPSIRCDPARTGINPYFITPCFNGLGEFLLITLPFYLLCKNDTHNLTSKTFGERYMSQCAWKCHLAQKRYALSVCLPLSLVGFSFLKQTTFKATAYQRTVLVERLEHQQIDKLYIR